MIKLFLISLILIIIFQFIFIVRIKRKLLFLKTQIPNTKDNISGKDLFENITKSKFLYKHLMKELHPDKYITNLELKKQAEVICFKLSKNKSSYRELVKIARSASTTFELSDKFKKLHPEIFSND